MKSWKKCRNRQMNSSSKNSKNVPKVDGTEKVAGLFQFRESLVEGRMDSWYEYIPATYNGEEYVPLVIQIHGANWDGYRDALKFSWRVLAEQKNFIVLYPNSHSCGHWDWSEEDLEFLRNLILKVCEKYKIDRTRVYMQGMSNGEKMASLFAMKYPELLAAAGFISGPWNPELLECRPTGSVPCIQLRGEKDIHTGRGKTPWMEEDPYAQRAGFNDFNLELWKDVNRTTDFPLLHVEGKDNFLRYCSEHGDVIYWEIKDMGHVEPDCLAWIFWKYLYSGWRKVDGVPCCVATGTELTGDMDTLILMVGKNGIYYKNKIQKMKGNIGVIRIDPPQNQRKEATLAVMENSCTPCIYVPLEMIETIGWGTFSLKINENMADVRLEDGRQLILYMESCNVIWNGVCHTLKKPCIYRGGTLYLPIREIAGELWNLFTAETDNAVIVSKRYCELTKGAVRLLGKIMDEND